MSSSVVSPMALTTTTTSWPASRARRMRSATARIRSALAKDEPPYFWTRTPNAPPESGHFEYHGASLSHRRNKRPARDAVARRCFCHRIRDRVAVTGDESRDGGTRPAEVDAECAGL